MALKTLYRIQLTALIFAFLVGLGTGGGLFAKEIDYTKEQLINLTARFEPSVVRRRENLRLMVEINFKPGWHIYSVIPSKNEDAPPPTKLILKSDDLIPESPVYETRPSRSFFKELGLRLYYHQKRAILYQNFIVKEESSPGSYKAVVAIVYQPCTDVICLPKRTKELSVAYEVVSGEPREEFASAIRSIDRLPEPSEFNELEDFLSGGFWTFIALAALMGLASLLTPCVFPMIPITITYFSKQAETQRKNVVKLSSLFAVGIIGTYTGVGLIVSIALGAGGALQLAANPYVNLIIAGIFIAFALSLMGLFEVSMPGAVQNYFDQKSRAFGGPIGVLLMGFTFTLTAFTCTVQFVGAMLIAAAHGEWIWPLIGMLVFSTVFAFPFFLLALAPGLIKKLQGRSGDWMRRSKVVLGILELMASIKFLSNADLVWRLNLLSRNRALFIWMALLGVVVLYLIWTGLRPRIRESFSQWGFVVFFSGLILAVGGGLNDRSLGSLIDALLPPPAKANVELENTVPEAAKKELQWLDSLEEAQKQAVLAVKPVFLEFTGYTCVNCRWMEQNVIPRKEIRAVLAQEFILVKLFTDGGGQGAENLQLQIDRFQTVALPYYVILSPDGEIMRKYSGISLNPEEFLAFLKGQTHN